MIEAIANYGTDSHIGDISYTDVPNEREIIINLQSVHLKYEKTCNNVDLLAKDRIDVYGTYDEYVDEDGNRYSFVQNTDLLCSFTKTHNLETRDKLITKEEAQLSAEEFLKGIIGEEAFSDYVLGSNSFYEDKYEYGLIYYYYLGQYKTDDAIYINVSNDGEITFFSALNLQKYKDLSIDKYNMKKVEKNISKYLSKYNDRYLQDKFISMKANGELVLTFEYVIKGNGYEYLDRSNAILVS